MAKPLVVEFQGAPVNLDLEKVDRTKLYGYVETIVQDESGKPCELATLAGDGHSIVGKGGSGLAYLSHDGRWRKKSELRPVDLQGKLIVPVRSTFDSPVALDQQATIDEYLSHNITSTYLLSPQEGGDELRAELKKGTIYRFPFSYRGGVEASAGFLLMGADGNLFLCVGSPTAFEFIGLKATAATVTDETDSMPDDDESLDFSMV